MSSTQSQPDPGETPAGRGREAHGDPRRGDRALRSQRLRGHEVGRHRRRRRRRAHRALPLLRVQAALPLRDHGPGDRGVPFALRAVEQHGADPLVALVSVMEDCFELSEHDVQRNRVLVAEQGLLSRRSGSPREEEARQAARARTRDLEFVWARFLSHATQAGTIPKSDPRLLTRAILGLYNSVWHWYHPNGIVALARVAEFFTDRSLALIGVAPEASARARAVA